MQLEAVPTQFYVIKARQIGALSFLAFNHPRPCRVGWINRGTDQPLRPSTVQQLLRTLHVGEASLNIQRARDAAGLRVIFRNERERSLFAEKFLEALAREQRFQNRLRAAYPELTARADQPANWIVDAGIDTGLFTVLAKAS